MLQVWNRIKAEHGIGWYWVVPRLRAGDVYHICSFAAAFRQTHGDAPIFLVVSSPHQANMAAVFDDHIDRVIVEPSLSSDQWKELALEADLPSFEINSPLLLDPWTNREIEPSAVAMFGPSGFLWTQFYKQLMRISLVAEPSAPAVRPDRVKAARALCDSADMPPGRSVLLFPFAQTYRADVLQHFTHLAEVLRHDYQVYTSVAGDEAPIPGTAPIFIPFALLQDVAEYAGWAVVLRSGIADILASARCRKTIVYRDLDAMQGWSLLQLDLARDASEFAFPFAMKSPELFASTVLAAPSGGDALFRSRGLADRVQGRHASLDELGAEDLRVDGTVVVRNVPYRAHPRLNSTERLRSLLDAVGPNRRLFTCRDSVLVDTQQHCYPFWEEISPDMLLSGRYDAASYWHNIVFTTDVLEPCVPFSTLYDDYLDLADPAAADARALSSLMTAPFGYKGVTLMRGWFPAESWGAWGEGANSRIRLVLENPPITGFILTLGLNLVISEQCPQLSLSVAVNGVALAEHHTTWDGPRDFETFIPPAENIGRVFDIDLRIEDYKTPHQHGFTGDPRPLGVGLRTLKVEPPRQTQSV
jgi:hypothetical protein